MLEACGKQQVGAEEGRRGTVGSPALPPTLLARFHFGLYFHVPTPTPTPRFHLLKKGGGDVDSVKDLSYRFGG